MTTGPILPPLVRLALPFAFAHVFSVFTLLIDRLWVGRVGTEALAALGTAYVTVMVFYTVSMGMAIGTLSGVARSLGADDELGASRFYGQGIYIAIGVGLVIGAAAFVLPEHVMEFMGAEASVSASAAEYLRISMWGLVVTAPLTSTLFALQGAGEASAALRVAVVAPIVNAILDPIFIFGLGLGLPGAAIATVIANAAGLAVGLRFVFGGELRLVAHRQAFEPRPDIAAQIVRIGVPGSLEHTVRTVASFSLVKILTGFGAAVMSAYTTSMVLIMALIFPGLAIGQATASLVGQNLGAQKPTRAWHTAWAGAGAYAAFMLVLGLLFWLLAGPLVWCFDSNPVVVAEGRTLLRVLALCFPFIALALILSKAFGGAGQTVPPMIAAAIAHLAFQIPMAWWLGELYGPVGAYAAMSGAFVVHGILGGGLFFLRFRPQNRE